MAGHADNKSHMGLIQFMYVSDRYLGSDEFKSSYH